MSDLSALKDAADYRGFLEAYLRVKGIPMAQFARKAGFASRGYPAEILKGHRKLSAKALPRFMQALQLNTQWKLYFQYLVALEEPSVLAVPLSPEQLQSRLAKLRRQLKSGPVRVQTSQPAEAADRIFGIPGFLRIYASLGEPGAGASPARIAERTKLDSKLVERALAEMLALGLARKDECSACYEPTSTHLSMIGMGASRLFRNSFLETLERVRARAAAKFASETDLFLVSSLTIDKSDLPAIKRELREVVLKYIDEKFTASGDTTIDLALGLIEPN